MAAANRGALTDAVVARHSNLQTGWGERRHMRAPRPRSCLTLSDKPLPACPVQQAVADRRAPTDTAAVRQNAAIDEVAARAAAASAGAGAGAENVEGPFAVPSAVPAAPPALSEVSDEPPHFMYLQVPVGCTTGNE